MDAFSDRSAPDHRPRAAELAPGRSPRSALQIRLIAAFLLGLLLCAGARAEGDRWYGIYLKGVKIGYQVSQRDPKALWGKAPAVREDDNIELKVLLLGNPSVIKETDTRWLDPKTGATLHTDSQVESAGRITRIRATYLPTGLRYRVEIGAQTTTGTLTLRPGERFVDFPEPSQLKVGWKRAGKTFQAETRTLIDTEIEVVGQESLDIDGAPTPAFRIAVRSGAPETVFVDARGELLRSDGAIGMSIRRESRSRALAPGGSAPDLSTLIAITPTGAPIDAPRAARTAVYRIGGVTRPLPAFDGVQSVAPYDAPDPKNDKNERTFTVTVTTGPLPDGALGRLYPDPATAPDALRPYLKATPYVQCDDPELKKLARETIAGAGSATEAARRLANFAHRAIRPDTSVPAVRSARDIHTDRRGVCRDYTTYFTTLARAVGLPTRDCVGVAYLQGAFYYHAWPQVWVGDRWVVLEPTWGEPFADATHIALAEGDATALTTVLADVGNYRIEVVSVGEKK